MSYAVIKLILNFITFKWASKIIMKTFCLNCFRKDVPLGWDGLCNSCSVRGVDIGNRYDSCLVMILWIWGFFFFTQFFHKDTALGGFLGGDSGDGLMVIVVISYLLLYIIPTLVFRKRNLLIYYGLNILILVIHPLYRIISFFLDGYQNNWGYY